ncbi:hypothetical protein FJ970_09090 [Mesorhizobium sp. B2-1-8]|uniref:hypothetical protein n=1 Tax=Mesorhizobium sp. B2-1-8 TaxID=2589967 RepID=UPI00112E2089|nr:hypothetical protein [Mesorhizobium sp. B2-1-8]UCI21086.1 hypothetical protein FJ970_09090 [Mesorhizobium sp. B2-1-8]
MSKPNLRFFVAGVACFGMAAPTLAEGKCLGPNGEFELGQYSCLAPGPDIYLARCETNQNVFSWNRIAGYCPGGAIPVRTDALSASCLSDGEQFPLGSFACLGVGGQRRLARCDMVLNSPSWTKMLESCSALPSPTAVASPLRPWIKKALDLPRGLLNHF